MKSYALVVTLMLICAAYELWREETVIAALRTAATTPPTASIEMQKSCADQAKKNFIDAGWSLTGAAVNGFLATYTSHYSVEFNRCFMKIYSLRGAPGIMETFTVIDAFEGREYAHYATFQNATTPVHITECDVSIPKLASKNCHSKEEWEALVGPLMGTPN